MELINIFDDLKNDMSIENIIKKYKIGLSRLIKIVKFHNNTGIDFEEKISKEIYDLKKCGNTYEEIAEISYTGVTYIRNYIKKYCTENNLEVPKLEFKRNKIDLHLKEIYDMKKSGVSVDKISDKYNVSCNTIYNRLKEYCNENNLDITEIIYSRRKVNLPMQEIYDMKKGLSFEEISWNYDVSETLIYKALNEYCTENNLEVPKLEFKRNKIDLPLKEIYDMKKSGVSVDKISDKYNVSYGTIYNRLKEINIEILLYLFQSIIDKENDKSINHFIEKEIGYAKQMKDH